MVLFASVVCGRCTITIWVQLRTLFLKLDVQMWLFYHFVFNPPTFFDCPRSFLAVCIRGLKGQISSKVYQNNMSESSTIASSIDATQCYI